MDDREFPFNEQNFLALLLRIKERPGMFMHPMVSRIAAFMDGYFFACSINPPREHPLWVRFTDWLIAKHHLQGNYRWEDVILFYTRDERDAFHKFYENFEEFLAKE